MHSFRLGGKIMIDGYNMRFMKIMLTYRGEIFSVLPCQEACLRLMRKEGCRAEKVEEAEGRKRLEKRP